MSNEHKNNISENGLYEKIVVTVDIELKDLILRYVEIRQEDIVRLQRALANDDYETIKTVGHGMKGSGVVYGFAYIGTIGAGIETSAGEKNRNEVETGLKQLINYMENLEIIYK